VNAALAEAQARLKAVEDKLAGLEASYNAAVEESQRLENQVRLHPFRSQIFL